MQKLIRLLDKAEALNLITKLEDLEGVKFVRQMLVNDGFDADIQYNCNLIDTLSDDRLQRLIEVCKINVEGLPF
jgi:hypothetical protein